MVEKLASSVKILAAFDKFKGTLNSREIGEISLKSLNSSPFSGFQSKILVLSDGGDGFLSSLTVPLELEFVQCEVLDPLGRPISTNFGVGKLPSSSESIGVIEMACASGLHLVPMELRNPLHTTSKGTGQLIAAAIKRGCTRIFLGVGGSATNDGGLGALEALGVEMEFAKEGKSYVPEFITGADLPNLVSIKKLPKLLASIEISCDVTSPFVGKEGAVSVFSGQKGAGEKEKQILEEGMIHLSTLIKETTGKDVTEVPGSGAAGGIAGGFWGLINASLKKGIEFVAAAHDLERHIQWADFVLTGEGCFDETSLVGKTPSKVIELAQKHQKPLLVICGEDRLKREEHVPFWERKIPVLSLVPTFDREHAMKNASDCVEELIQRNLEDIHRLIERR
eukprot:TRINITY_DN3758_c0_g3_i3.p1 TRINITY_DN3758_c0_g3~~TRINITY_DN3758_c0_g3_i3.p1  ORF type:complete len:395 (+),score=147.12 TRINITY_DN3758_c0_g3_i3:166-1350(+)